MAANILKTSADANAGNFWPKEIASQFAGILLLIRGNDHDWW